MIRLASIAAMVGLCILCRAIWTHWSGNGAVAIFTVAGALMMAVLTYGLAPLLPVVRSGYRATVAANAPRTLRVGPQAGQDRTIHWFDVPLTNPLYLIVSGAGALILLAWVLYVTGSRVLAPAEKLLSPVALMFLIFVGMLLLLVYMSGSFIGSLRAFGSLPITKGRLTTSFLLLPFVALLPVAFSSIFISSALLAVYVVGVGCWLICNLVYMRWGAFAALIALQTLLALLGLWQFGHSAMAAAKRPEAVGLLAVLGVVCSVLMIVVPGIWTWRLLLRSNAPYQKKPGLAFRP